MLGGRSEEQTRTKSGKREQARFLKLGRLGLWLQKDEVRVCDWGTGEIALSRAEARELGEVLGGLKDA